jgi:hypothetical protein
MKFFPFLLSAALLGAGILATAPAAQAQVNVNVNVGRPAWGPAAPQGTQFYYIPEIDGYYDLYAQQYIVYRDGRWMPVTVVNGYDPYQFHPVVLEYLHRDRYPTRVVVRPGRGLPPGQAKKMYRQGYREGYREDRRQDRREDHDDDRDDDRGHGKGKDHGRGHDRD